MALAISFTTTPEVLALSIPRCGRHQLDMILVDANYPGLYRCPAPGCENSYDDPPQGDGNPPYRRVVCVRPTELVPKDNPLIERAFGYEAGHVVDPVRWNRHVKLLHEKVKGRKGLPPVPQCNADDGTRCLLLGGVAHGGGSKSGRRRKKTKGGKTFTDGEWWNEGGTNGGKKR